MKKGILQCKTVICLSFWARTDTMGRNNKGVIGSDKKAMPGVFFS
jgi:hypothetical protein